VSELIPDRWAEWVLTTRYGTDEAHRRRVLDYLRPIRDRVLKNASISAGDTLIDVGTGDGLIAFGAVPLVGAEGKVILSDVSPNRKSGWRRRCPIPEHLAGWRG
jgi:arsenite methyltransferase